MAQYATIAEADSYFTLEKLHSELWLSSTGTDKDKALIQATRAIDILKYIGDKHSVWLVKEGDSPTKANILAAVATQVLQFPRGSDTVVPEDIKIACYEIAFAFLDGVDPEQELEKLTVASEGFSSVRTTYDRTFVQEHYNAGIPSSLAWRYLKKYLRNVTEIRLSRVN